MSAAQAAVKTLPEMHDKEPQQLQRLMASLLPYAVRWGRDKSQKGSSATNSQAFDTARVRQPYR